MVEAGGGHKSPAMAIRDSLEEHHPGAYDLRLIDLFKGIGCSRIDMQLKQFWDFLLAHPFLCKASFYAEELLRPLVLAWRAFYLKPALSKLYEYLRSNDADLVFSTHFFVAYLFAEIKRAHNLRYTLINMDSDPFDIHLWWVLKTVDEYIVNSEEAKGKLISKGVPEDILRVFHYPINNKFFRFSHDKNRTLDSLGLARTNKTLLITFGSQGVGSLDKYLDAIQEEHIDLNVIIVCGKNRQQYEHLTAKYSKRHGRSKMVPLEYVTNMNEIINACDFGFIKPGAATTFEFMSMKKPVILYSSAVISENGNIRFILKNRLGLYAGHRVGKFMRSLKSLLNDSAYAEFMSNYQKCDVRSGSDDIANHIVHILEKGSSA